MGLDLTKNRISKRSIVCFVSGVIAGWITHFYMLTHKLPNWDDISQINGLGLTTQIGRWMLKPLSRLTGRISNPAVNGMILIVLISVSACFLMEALDLKSTFASVIVPMIMVTFPSVTGIMYFMFTAHLYGFGILFFSMAFYAFEKYNYGAAFAAVFIVLGLAVYQPFVSIIISMCLVKMVLDGLEGKTFKPILKQGLVYAATIGVATVIYIVIAHLIYPNMSNETYGGVSEMGRIPLSDMPRNFGRVYKRVLEYFVTKPFAYTSRALHVVQITVCVAVVTLFVIGAVRNRIWKDRGGLVLTCLAAFLLPFAMGFVYFMAPEAPFSTLMLYAYSILYVFAVALAERISGSCCWIKLLSLLTAAAVTIACFNHYLIDANAYFRTGIAFERVTNYFNRIIAAVESKEGYEVGDNVLILGEFYYKDNPAPVEMRLFANEEGYRELSGVALENGLITEGARMNFVRTYMGFNPGYVDEEKKQDIKASSAYNEMSVYPNEQSIQKIDDVWVVKLCE